MGGHRACRTIASWAGVVSLFLPSVVLTGNCNAKNVAGPISGALHHHAALAVPPAAVRNVAGPISLSAAPALL